MTDNRASKPVLTAADSDSALAATSGARSVEIEKSKRKALAIFLRTIRKIASLIYRTYVLMWRDGFLHAGTFAYLALVALFPFFITATAIAGFFGQSEGGRTIIEGVLTTMPPNVVEVVRQPIYDVLAARTGPLLWIGAIVGLWTAGSIIEVIRDILRRAYDAENETKFWRDRLNSIALVIVALFLLLLSFSLEVLYVTAERLAFDVIPGVREWITEKGLLGMISRYIPLAGVFLTLYILFNILTPIQCRGKGYPKWPGALLTTLWWGLVLWGLPLAIASVVRYDLAYGSLAGVMITLLFFYIIGLGVVIGATFNVALARLPGHVTIQIAKVKNLFAKRRRKQAPQAKSTKRGSTKRGSTK